jgi:class 3 adenylate cyclase
MALTFSNRCWLSPKGLNASRLGGKIPLTREPLVRRLTAIFAADVAGYSCLTGLDEEGTHVRLKEHLRLLIDPKVAAHRGHIAMGS